MESIAIPYSRVPHSSKLLIDYLYQYDRLSAFYSGSPTVEASFQRISEAIRPDQAHRKRVATILERQNRAFGCGADTLANIDRLSQPGTWTVVAGQQVGLFLGPAFTLYKALTTVGLAEALTRRGIPTVPVFWLATEDHDFEEVARVCALDDEYELVELRDAGEQPNRESSVGFVRLAPEITATLGQFEAVLPAGPAREAWLTDLRACYRPGAKWGEAFGQLLTKLFSRWGVVMLDPLDEEAHGLSIPIYEGALQESDALRAALQERSAELVKAGYHAQVRVADDSTLLFTAPDGHRLPLHRGRTGNEFVRGDGDIFSLEQLKRMLHDHPLDFSGNALLRPIVQDRLLPTVAYVGGPSELAYLGQAQAIYPAFGRPMPVVFPRAGFTLLDRRVQRLMTKYDLQVEDVWKGENHLAGKIAAAGSADAWSERFDQSERELDALLERLRGDIRALDPTLLDALKHAEEKMKFQMERLRGKLARAALDRSDLLARHQRALLRFILPGKGLQEREISGAYFLGSFGYALLDRLLARIQMESSDHQIFPL